MPIDFFPGAQEKKRKVMSKAWRRPPPLHSPSLAFPPGAAAAPWRRTCTRGCRDDSWWQEAARTSLCSAPAQPLKGSTGHIRRREDGTSVSGGQWQDIPRTVKDHMHDHPSGTPCVSVSFGGHIQVAFRFMSYGNLSWALPGAGADIRILAQKK